MIFTPPRHGKSDLTTQKFPSWVLGKRPDFPIIVASYAQGLATKFGLGTRDLMNSHNYQALFSTRLRDDSQAKSNFLTDQGGGYEAVGVGGPITGKGFKIGIIDDPFKNFEEADSEVIRDNVDNWYTTTFLTREEGNAAIILILTRWHDDDLAGRRLKEQAENEKNGDSDYDKWEVINLPAIAEVDDEYRKKGEALWPGKFPISKLRAREKTLGPYQFAALYQQNPIAEGGGEFRKDWLRYRTWDDVQKMETRKFATIDTALSKTDEADATGVTCNYVDLANNWNIKSKQYRINSAQLIELIFDLHTEGFEQIGIEEGAYKAAIEPFLQKEMTRRAQYPYVVTLKHNQISKHTRIRGVIPKYACGEVFHITGECDDLEPELLRFPKATHDDCADSLAYQLQLAQPPAANDNVDFGLYGANFQ